MSQDRSSSASIGRTIGPACPSIHPLIVCAVAVCMAVAAAMAFAGGHTVGSPLKPMKVAPAIGSTGLTINADQGVDRGHSIFFTLSSLNLKAGQQITFHVPADTQNIFVRINSGMALIDGSIHSATAGAALFLMDPAGIRFGPDASLSVFGSFVATTASYVELVHKKRTEAFASSGDAGTIRLVNGSKVPSAVNRGAPLLSSYTPVAFGFLSRRAPGAIRVNGALNSTLAVQPEFGLSLVGGKISVSGNTLSAAQGRINLVSAGGRGSVSMNPDSIGTSIDVSKLPMQGPIDLSANAAVSAFDGGSVVARGIVINLDDSAISTFTDIVAGGSVDLEAHHAIGLHNSVISVSTDSTGDGGLCRLRAEDISMGGDRTYALTQDSSAINAETSSTGRAGDVAISAHDISMKAGAVITASNSSTGNGGDVSLHATHGITMDGTGAPIDPSTNAPSSTGVNDTTSGAFLGAGQAGAVRVQSPRLTILNQADIVSKTKGDGAAGIIHVDVRDLMIDGEGAGTFTGLESRVGDSNAGAQGLGGKITVYARDAIDLKDGGVITATTFGRGNAGNVQVEANQVVMDDRNPGLSQFDGVFGRTTLRRGGGHGGNVELLADSLSMFGPAEISASCDDGSGKGGNVDVECGAISISGPGQITASSSGVHSIGDAGKVVVKSQIGDVTLNNGVVLAQPQSGAVRLSDGAVIAARSQHTNAGAVFINSGSDVILDDDASIAASAGSLGGNIDISAPGNVSLYRSQITGRSGGAGGQITIDPRVVSLGDSVIDGKANVTTNNPAGKDVRVVIDGDLLQSDDSRIISNNAAFTLDSYLAQSIVALTSRLSSVTARLQDSCASAVRSLSSFAVTGRGGVASDPGTSGSMDAEDPSTDSSDLKRKQ